MAKLPITPLLAVAMLLAVHSATAKSLVPFSLVGGEADILKDGGGAGAIANTIVTAGAGAAGSGAAAGASAGAEVGKGAEAASAVTSAGAVGKGAAASSASGAGSDASSASSSAVTKGQSIESAATGAAGSADKKEGVSSDSAKKTEDCTDDTKKTDVKSDTNTETKPDFKTETKPDVNLDKLDSGIGADGVGGIGTSIIAAPLAAKDIAVTVAKEVIDTASTLEEAKLSLIGGSINTVTGTDSGAGGAGGLGGGLVAATGAINTGKDLATSVTGANIGSGCGGAGALANGANLLSVATKEAALGTLLVAGTLPGTILSNAGGFGK